VSGSIPSNPSAPPYNACHRWVRERNIANQVAIRPWGRNATKASYIGSSPGERLGFPYDSIRVQPQPSPAASVVAQEWLDFSLEGLAEGRIGFEEAVGLIVHAAVPAWRMTNEGTLVSSPLFAAAVESCSRGNPVQNTAKFLALLLVAAEEPRAMEVDGVVRNILDQIDAFTGLLAQGPCDTWFQPHGFWADKVDTAYLLKQVGRFGTLRAQNSGGGLDYLKLIPLLNMIASKGSTKATIDFKSPCVELRKHGRAGDAASNLPAEEAAVAAFSAMMNAFHDSGTFERDRLTGQPVASLEIELARGAPSMRAFLAILEKLQGSEGMVADMLGAAHHMALFWRDPAHEDLVGVLRYLAADREDAPVRKSEQIYAASCRMLSSFATAAKKPEEGSFLFHKVYTKSEKPQNKEWLKNDEYSLISPEVCLNVLSNTRAFTDVEVDQMLDLVTEVYKTDLSPGEKKEQAKAMLKFLDVRLYAHPLGKVFEICDRCARVDFLTESAMFAAENQMRVQDIEPLMEQLHSMNFEKLEPQIAMRIKKFARQRVAALCEGNERCRVLVLGRKFLEAPSPANMGHDILQTVASGGLSALEMAKRDPLGTLTALVTNQDLLLACVEQTRLFQKFRPQLVEQANPAAPPDRAVDEAAKLKETGEMMEAMQLDLEMGMITAQEFETKVQSLERAAAAESTQTKGSPAEIRNGQLVSLILQTIQLMPTRGLIVRQASAVMSKKEHFDALIELAKKEPGGALQQAINTTASGDMASIWSRLEEHSSEAKTLRRLLDVYVNQFLANVMPKLDAGLAAFPTQARLTLSSWDDMLLHEVKSAGSVEFILMNQAQLDRFSLLLGSTMIFPVVKQRYLDTVERGSVTASSMAETVIPELLARWEVIARQVADGTLTVREAETWFESLFEEGVAECAQSPATMKETELIGTSLRQPEATATIVSRLDSLVFLKLQRDFIMDFCHLITSLKHSGKFSEAEDPLWNDLKGVVATLGKDYGDLSLTGVATFTELLEKMKRILDRMDASNRQFIAELNLLEEQHCLIEQLDDKKHAFIVQASVFAKFANVTSENRDGYDKKQLKAFDEFTVIRGLLCNVMHPERPFASTDAFIEVVQNEARKLAEDENLINYIQRSNLLLNVVRKMNDGQTLDTGVKDAKLLDRVVEHGIWKIASPTASTGNPELLARDMKLWNSQGDPWLKEGGFPNPWLSLQEAQDLSDRLFLLEDELKKPRESTIDDFQQFIDRIHGLNRTLVLLHLSGNQQEGSDGYSFEFPLSRTNTINGSYVELDFVNRMREEREDSYHAWNKGVNWQRAKHTYLNYFTVHQMMRLVKDCVEGKTENVKQALKYLSADPAACEQADKLIQRLKKFVALAKAPEEELVRTMTHKSQAIVEEGAWAMGLMEINGLGESLTEVMHNVSPRVRPLNIQRALAAAAAGATEEAGLESARMSEALLQSSLTAGVPNNIATESESKVVSVLLTLYAQLERAPEANEILICDPSTTPEEVGLILGRCGAHKGENRLYTIAYAHLLSATATEMMLSLIKDMIHMGTIGNLAVVSTSGGDEGSRVAEALNKYSCVVLPPTRPLLQALVAELFHATPDKEATRETPYASTFSSELVGAGKSYRIEKMAGESEIPVTRIPLYSGTNDENLQPRLTAEKTSPKGRALHLMLSPTVDSKTDRLLFSLLALQDLQDADGGHYKVEKDDCFFVEIPNQCVKNETENFAEQLPFLHLLPNVTVLLDETTMDYSRNDVQFVCKYLQALGAEPCPLTLTNGHQTVRDKFSVEKYVTNAATHFSKSAGKLEELVFKADPLDAATCHELLTRHQPKIAGEGSPAIGECSMIISCAWIKFVAKKLFDIEKSMWLGGNTLAKLLHKYNDREDFYERLIQSQIGMASSFTGRTISVKSLLVEQIEALNLDPENEQQSLMLMNTWKEQGIIFQAMRSPNPNDGIANFWVENTGNFRPVCLDPAGLSAEVKAYWEACGAGIVPDDGKAKNPGAKRAPEFTFIDYSKEVVHLPKEHPHIKVIFEQDSHQYRPHDHSEAWLKYQDVLKADEAQREAVKAAIEDATLRAAVEQLEKDHKARRVTSQDALFELLIDIVGQVDYPGGRDLYKEVKKGGRETNALASHKERYGMFKGFVLTIDNVFKMLAVYFRLQAGMPVVIMGETGCGKTFSIKYLATILAFPFYKLDVHGGLNEQDVVDFMIHGKPGEENPDNIGPLVCAQRECDFTTQATEEEKIKYAGKKRAPKKYSPQPVWVFFDEVNTCDAVGLFREMVCDRSMRGRPLPPNIKVIAALNPYRLKPKAGRTTVGIAHKNVDQELADSKGIAFRDLVYVVHPIPRTMLEYIWDYGTLGMEEETRYMRAMLVRGVHKEAGDQAWHLSALMGEGVAGVELFARYFGDMVQEAHNFLRSASGGEVSVVSLRDVARCVKLFGWFRKFLWDKNDVRGSHAQAKIEGHELATKAFVLALSHCYYFRLQDKELANVEEGADRESFRKRVSVVANGVFRAEVEGGRVLQADHWTWDEASYDAWLQMQMKWFIDACSPLPPGIAANVALTENMFMMIVCIVCTIPLIVVGNPGTSKTLAMTIICEKLNPYTKAPIFDVLGLPSILPFSYQCSRHSTADEILRRFVDAKKAQDKANAGVGTGANILNTVVFLDEVGLAEESPHMPLKVLHKLLETPEVSFIGLSNWNLDPAKMNRAIYLVRPETKSRDLCSTASSIVGKHRVQLTQKMGGLAEAYIQITHQCSAIPNYADFFGLRDFYTFVKLLDRYLRDSKAADLNQEDFNRAIFRCFGGLPSQEMKDIVAQAFWGNNQYLLSNFERGTEDMILANGALALVRENLQDLPRMGKRGPEPGGRHLMILSENESGLDIMLEEGAIANEDTELILGSAFPDDKSKLRSYHNINRIKEAMKMGKRVVLLHLDDLYESLYDMLNQQYTSYLDTTYCRLAIGAQSRFCEVHDAFRCIVVVDSEQAYTKLDAPLLNRFEKQVLSRRELLTPEHRELEGTLLRWCSDFVKPAGNLGGMAGGGMSRTSSGNPRGRTELLETISNAFIGFNDETIPSLLRSLEVSKNPPENLIAAAKEELLWIVTPESLLRTKNTLLQAELHKNSDIYFRKQEHGSLPELVEFGFSNEWNKSKNGFNLFCCTFSPLFSTSASWPKRKPVTLNLESYSTVKQLEEDIEMFFRPSSYSTVLLIQADCKSRLSVDRLQHAKYITAQRRAEVGDEALNKAVVLVAHLQFIHYYHIWTYNPRFYSLQVAHLQFIHYYHIWTYNPRFYSLQVAHLQKDDSVSGVVQNLSLQFSGGWRYATVDTLYLDADMPTMRDILALSVDDILHGDSGNKVNLTALLAANMRRCIAYLAYPRALRPEPMALHEQLLGLLDVPAFEGILRARMGEMIKEESLQDGWQSQMVQRDIASAGTFTVALYREVSSLVVTAFTKWMEVADVHGNIALFHSLSESDPRRRIWLDIAIDPTQTLAHFPVVTKSMERIPVSVSDRSFEPIHNQFPYSNIVYTKVHSVLQGIQSLSPHDIFAAIDNTPIGRVLGKLDPATCRHYLIDAVQLAHLCTRPVKEYTLLATTVVEAQLADAHLGFDQMASCNVAQVHVGVKGCESILRSLLELQGAMEALNCGVDCVKILKSLQAGPGKDGENRLASVVKQFTEAAVDRVISMLTEDAEVLDEDYRLDTFTSNVMAFSAKLQAIFEWGEKTHPDFTALTAVAQRWIHCKMVADFIKTVVYKLEMQSVGEALAMLEALPRNGFTVETLTMVVESMRKVESSHPDRSQQLWAFLELFMMKYAFHPVMVGARPENDFMTMLCFMASIEGSIDASKAPEAYRAKVSSELLGPLKEFAKSTGGGGDMELSTQCRVSIAGNILNRGDYMAQVVTPY